MKRFKYTQTALHFHREQNSKIKCGNWGKILSHLAAFYNLSFINFHLAWCCVVWKMIFLCSYSKNMKKSYKNSYRED